MNALSTRDFKTLTKVLFFKRNEAIAQGTIY